MPISPPPSRTNSSNLFAAVALQWNYPACFQSRRGTAGHRLAGARVVEYPAVQCGGTRHRPSVVKLELREFHWHRQHRKHPRESALPVCWETDNRTQLVFDYPNLQQGSGHDLTVLPCAERDRLVLERRFDDETVGAKHFCRRPR